ncbi:MAG: YitT family protein [Fusobacterium sp.]|nr:YitT family protein [Fusobacterium sp.]
MGSEKFNFSFWAILRKVFFLTLGALTAAFAIECFLVPNQIIDGGIVGVSIILNHFFNQFGLGMFIFALNIPFFLLAFNKIGKKFVVQTIYAIIALSLGVNYFHHFETITAQPILIVVFGGILLGTGVGLVLKSGGSMDGTEILSVVLSKKFGFSVGEWIMAFNVIIYTAAGFVFGVENAMYAILTYLVAYKVIDIVQEGFNTSKAVRIVSSKSREIGTELMETLELGVTYVKGTGAFSGKEKEIIFCVVSRLELNKLKEIAKSIDNNAFITVEDVHETYGGQLKKKKKKKKH